MYTYIHCIYIYFYMYMNIWHDLFDDGVIPLFPFVWSWCFRWHSAISCNELWHLEGWDMEKQKFKVFWDGFKIWRPCAACLVKGTGPRKLETNPKKLWKAAIEQKDNEIVVKVVVCQVILDSHFWHIKNHITFLCAFYIAFFTNERGTSSSMYQSSTIQGIHIHIDSVGRFLETDERLVLITMRAFRLEILSWT